MKELKEIIQYAQRQLRLKDDGIIGPKTHGKLEKATKRIPAIGRNWPIQRKAVAFVQVLALKSGIDPGSIDGFIGPQTLYAWESLVYLQQNGQVPSTWRDEDKANPVDKSVNRDANPNNWPRYQDMRSTFGQPGSHLITVRLPYAMRLAWDTNTTVSRLTCHRKVAKSLTGVLEVVRDHHGISGIADMGLNLYGGCYNFRKMRGGTQFSTHAWGAAIDLDPSHNRLKWDHTKARFAKPEYQFLLDAFAREGWVSLGEAKDYDWMHFQAVRL